MYHTFFIHLSADGYLGHFHVLAIVRRAVVNIGVHVSFCIRVFSRFMPRNGIAGSYGNSVFCRTSILFSTVGAPTYFPTNGVGGFPFLHTLSSICYL